jgi:signal transduction histidine kinase
VAIGLRRQGGRLVVRVGDNGRGFDARTASGGQGLVSMQRRAEALGGRLDVVSGVGAGTTLTLTAPSGRRWPWRRS